MTLEAMILNNLLLLAKYSPLIQIHLNLKATKYPAINSGLHHPKKKEKKEKKFSQIILTPLFHVCLANKGNEAKTSQRRVDCILLSSPP